MTQALKSWKEVARYVRKGLRTVQRWEQEWGLPVRRPERGVRQVVLAFPDEIDEWMQSQFQRPQRRAMHDSLSEVAALRQKIIELEAANEALRNQLAATQTKRKSQMPTGCPSKSKRTEFC